MDQRNVPIYEMLQHYLDAVPTQFTIPGHHRGAGISARWQAPVFRLDVTETPGTDDLHAPTGGILQAERLAAEAFGADETYFLVNGTTCGVEAMILAAAKPGRKILVARNAHKSALMGLILSGAEPVWVQPEYSAALGLTGGISPAAVEAAFAKAPDAAAFLLVCPDYYGVCSDLPAIAAVCHRHGAMLLVDEAHGAHLHFCDCLPPDAMACGADMAVQSVHKTAGALTQASMLHLRRGRTDTGRMRAALHLVQSTSPSYLIMTSLDFARSELALHGSAFLRSACRLAQSARTEIRRIPGFFCPGAAELVGQCAVAAFDPTRVAISAAGLGLSGFALRARCYDEFGVDFELADERYALAIFSYASTAQDVRALLTALRAIAQSREFAASPHPACALPSFPPACLSPRDAFFAEKKAISWSDAVGAISGETVAPYPPGIPVLCPGERITQALWDYLENCRKLDGHFQGPSDDNLNTIQVIAAD